MTRELVTYRVAGGSGAVDADPVTTEVVRNSLNIAANQMKRAIVRTAFSPCIVEVLDFAVAIYDRRVRMLAQAPSMPIFMGTMNFCVESAVASVGGEENLEPGDIIIYNDPFGMGSHQQDLALVMPVYPQRCRADRLHHHQGPSARHRGQGPLLHRHRRCLPGRHDLSRHQALQARRARRRDEPHAARQLAGAEDGRRRHSRRGGGLPDRRGGADRSGRAFRARNLQPGHGAHVRPRRIDRAQLLRAHSRRPLCRPRGHGRRWRERRESAVRRHRRGRGLDGADRLLDRPRYPPRPDQHAAGLDDLGQPVRHHHAGRRLRSAERGALSPHRGGDAARLDVPSGMAGAVLPLRLAGDAGDRGDLPGALPGHAQGGARVFRRRCLRHDLLGQRPRDRRAVGRRRPPPHRSGRARSRRRRLLDAHHAGRHPVLADRDLGGQVPLAGG